MSAWEGVDLAVVREAVERIPGGQIVRVELSENIFGGQSLIYISTIDSAYPRRKPKKVLPGPIVGDDYSTILRTLADILDGTLDSLVATDPREAGS